MSVGVDLARFNSFKDTDFRSCEVTSATDVKLIFAVQDEARAFDWITLTLEFSEVSDARLIDSSKLAYIDMSEGISIIKEGDSVAFGIGECYNIASIKSSSSFIVSKGLKSFEGTF